LADLGTLIAPVPEDKTIYDSVCGQLADLIALARGADDKDGLDVWEFIVRVRHKKLSRDEARRAGNDTPSGDSLRQSERILSTLERADEQRLSIDVRRLEEFVRVGLERG